MDITYALQSLRPGSEWSLNGNTYDGLIWYNSNELPPPTEEVVLVEVERLKQDWKNNQYQRERAVAYPSIQDQLDILYHQGYDGWKEEINKIKERYPKP